MKEIDVIGAGLAGVEAAYYLSSKGVKVHLYEKRPTVMTPAHHSGDFAELVCSNSLKNNLLDNACGLLKEEMRMMSSLIMKVAEKHRVPSGNALSVDREEFSKEITEIIKNDKNIIIHNEDVEVVPPGICIIATGPLTSDKLTESLIKIMGEKTMSFYDASAPIVYKDSIDMDIAYFKSRYDQGDDSYINCPFNKEQYAMFINELIHGRIASLHKFDTQYFEGCMPIEVMAKRGEKTLRFGPLKPKGLWRNKEDRSVAVVQLRQDNYVGDLYNIVGFQTNLKYKEQERIFRLIPGLENARFARYGLMHRNTYICSPKVLYESLNLKMKENVFIAGQLSGVEGYVESAATGIIAAVNALKYLENKELVVPPVNTMIGALIRYIIHAGAKDFSPMNANYGILFDSAKRDRIEIAKESLSSISKWWKEIHE